MDIRAFQMEGGEAERRRHLEALLQEMEEFVFIAAADGR
jgi:hypothetical protein